MVFLLPYEWLVLPALWVNRSLQVSLDGFASSQCFRAEAALVGGGAGWPGERIEMSWRP